MGKLASARRERGTEKERKRWPFPSSSRDAFRASPLRIIAPFSSAFDDCHAGWAVNQTVTDRQTDRQTAFISARLKIEALQLVGSCKIIKTIKKN